MAVGIDSLQSVKLSAENLSYCRNIFYITVFRAVCRDSCTVQGCRQRIFHSVELSAEIFFTLQGCQQRYFLQCSTRYSSVHRMHFTKCPTSRHICNSLSVSGSKTTTCANSIHLQSMCLLRICTWEFYRFFPLHLWYYGNSMSHHTNKL